MDFLGLNSKSKTRKKNGQETIGLSLLGSISAFSIWSALNPSWFTISAFMTSKQVPHVKAGMNAGMILIVVLSVALVLSYGRKGILPAAITGVTGAGLYLSYHMMIKKNNGNGTVGNGRGKWQEQYQN